MGRRMEMKFIYVKSTGLADTAGLALVPVRQRRSNTSDGGNSSQTSQVKICRSLTSVKKIVRRKDVRVTSVCFEKII